MKIKDIIEILKPFRGSRLDYIRENLPRRLKADYKRLTRGMNGTVFEDFVSMLYNGSYNLITAKGPDFGNIELKLTTYKEDCNIKGTISICDIKDESWNDSNFKKKIENLIIVVCIGKPGKEDKTCCFVDILTLNEDLRDCFISELRNSYEIQRKRYLIGKTSGVSDGVLISGLLKLSNKTLGLTDKTVKRFFISSFEKTSKRSGTALFLFGLEKKSISICEAFQNWFYIYKNPISLEEFKDLLYNTAGFKSMLGQLKSDKHKPGDTWRDGEIIYTLTPGGELKKAIPGNFKKDEIQKKDILTEFFNDN